MYMDPPDDEDTKPHKEAEEEAVKETEEEAESKEEAEEEEGKETQQEADEDNDEESSVSSSDTQIDSSEMPEWYHWEWKETILPKKKLSSLLFMCCRKE
jgi:hypothetical protein